MLGAVGFACTETTDGGTVGGLDSGSPGPGSGDAATDGSTPDGGASDGGGPRADGVVRELVFRQIQHVATQPELPTAAPVISANGQKIAFAVAPGTESDATPNKIFVINADGSGLKQVDSYKTNCFCNSIVAISDDGNTIVSSDSTQVRVVDGTGALKASLVLDNNVVANVAINGAGTEAFFIAARDSNQTKPTAIPRQRGTYSMKADGSAINQILSPQTVAPLVGKTDPNDVFPFAGCGTSLSVSADGAKVYSVVNVGGVGQAVIAGGSAGGASVVVPPLTEGDKLVYGVAVSRGGNKLAYWMASAAGGELGVMGPDGSGKTKLVDFGAGVGCGSPLTISGDGSKVALSGNGMVYPTNGGDPWPVLTGMGFFSNDPAFIAAPDNSLSMAADGKSFAYLNTDGTVGRQLASAILDPTDTGAAPKVTEPKVAPAEIPHDLSAGATMSARVSGSPLRVGGQVFLKGLVDSNAVHADRVLLPIDGGAYAAEGVNASTNAVVGPRLLRIRAEGKDSSGLRSAHAVDFGPFSIR